MNTIGTYEQITVHLGSIDQSQRRANRITVNDFTAQMNPNWNPRATE
jgi:hypothetical protein